ncbi:MAG: hypothetical protein V4547_19525 [Bacteroidota bacterium]
MKPKKPIKRPTKKQVDFLRISLGLSGIVCNPMSCESVLITQSEMRRLGGKFSMRDGARIEAMIIEIYKREDNLAFQSLKNEVEKIKRDLETPQFYTPPKTTL